MAIETVPAVVKMFELIGKLLESHSNRRKELFRELFEPVFNDLTSIHQNYISVLTRARDSISLEKKTNEARNIIIAEREEYEYLREHIRQAADIYIGKRRNLNKEEKRFLWAIICYFICPFAKLGDNKKIDLNIKWLEIDGPHDVFDTPAAAIARKILDKDDPKEIKAELERALSNQRDRWKDACRLYNELKSSVFINKLA